MLAIHEYMVEKRGEMALHIHIQCSDVANWVTLDVEK